MVLETWREALPDRVIVAGARDITMAIEARRGRADALLAFPERSDPVGYHRGWPGAAGDRVLSVRGGGRRGLRRRHAARDSGSARGDRHQGRDARLGDDLPAHRRPSSGAIPTSCSSPAKIASSATRSCWARARRSIGMGAALPDLQAELLRAFADARLGRAFIACSAAVRPARPGDLHRADGRLHPPHALGGRGGRRAAARRRATIPGDRALPSRESAPPSSAWSAMRERLARDFERFGARLPRDFASVRAGDATGSTSPPATSAIPLPHPIGKGSGQLSLNRRPARDRPRGRPRLRGAQDRDRRGCRRASAPMGAWAIHETRMKVERRSARRRAEAAGPSPGRAGAGTARSTTTSRWSAPPAT